MRRVPKHIELRLAQLERQHDKTRYPEGIMRVPAYMTMDAWEAAAVVMQAELVATEVDRAPPDYSQVTLPPLVASSDPRAWRPTERSQ